MKNFLFALSLLLICLPPCTAQTKNSPSRLHSSPRQAALHTPVSQPKALRPAAGGPFSDVPKDHWAAAAVETLRQRGIVKGYPASK